MNLYHYYEPNGRIVHSQTANDEEHATLTGVSLSLPFIAGTPGVTGGYVKNGVVVELPAQPGPSFTFDYNLKQWIDPRGLEELKAAAWERIKAFRNAMELEGFPYLGKTFDSDATSLQRITTTVQAAQTMLASGQPFSIEWTTADNSTITLTAEQVVMLPVVMATYANTLHQTGKALHEQIEQATSPEDIAAVQWPETI